MNSQSLSSFNDAKSTNAFFAASLVLIMSVLIVLSGFFENDLLNKSDSKPYDIYQTNTVLKNNPGPNSNLKLMVPATNEELFTNKEQALETEKLLERMTPETSSPAPLFGNSSVFELSEEELEVFAEELLDDVHNSYEPVLPVPETNVRRERKIEPNFYLEELAEKKNQELLEYYDFQNRYQEYFMVDSENELNLEKWMTNEDIWSEEEDVYPSRKISKTIIATSPLRK